LRPLWLVAALFLAAALVSLVLDGSVRITMSLVIVGSILNLVDQRTASRPPK